MKNIRKWPWLIFLTVVTLIPGPVLCKIYCEIVAKNPQWAMGLYGQRVNISIVTATFAFTMMGFLAAAMAVLVSFSGTSTFKNYKRRGYLDILLWFCFYSIICLVVTFSLSLLGFSKTGVNLIFLSTMSSAVNNLAQLILISLITINMARKAGDEES